MASPASTLADTVDFNTALAQMNERFDPRAPVEHRLRLQRHPEPGPACATTRRARLSTQLPPLLGCSTAPLPQLPARYMLKRNNINATVLVVAVWPIYVAGASDAAHALQGAQTREAQADDLPTKNDLTTQLVQRKKCSTRA